MADSNIEVLKIGGGILRNKDCFERVINVVKDKSNSNKKIVIVLSALYGVTDYLIESSKKCILHESEIQKAIFELKNMHYQYLDFIKTPSIQHETKAKLNQKIDTLEKILYGVNYLNELSLKSKDYIQSFGERLSPIILNAILLDNKINSKFLDAIDAGIICKGNYENAQIDLRTTEKNLLKLKNELNSTVILLPGYYGVDLENNTKTFGRGGTDYSAGIIANIFDAKLEIIKDVSGFMSADPKLIKTAVQLPFISYSEAEELGYLGAKILHPKTIAPLRAKNLIAEIKDLFNYQKTGTIICGEDKTPAKIKSITNSSVSIITIKSDDMVDTPGFAGELFTLIGKKEISVDLISTSETSISFSVKPIAIKSCIEQLKKLNANYNIEVKEKLSMIGIVGKGLIHNIGIAGKIFSVLGINGINIYLISQGSSELNLSFVINEKDVKKAIQEIHNQIILNQ
ncbi:MAG: aspartate kinase [Candidatus ainarchaeum sp.]|nr:aspartate kinase [Candidatus ainarchaeum sp.]